MGQAEDRFADACFPEWVTKIGALLTHFVLDTMGKLMIVYAVMDYAVKYICGRTGRHRKKR